MTNEHSTNDGGKAAQSTPVLNFNGTFHNYGTITGDIVNPTYYHGKEKGGGKDSAQPAEPLVPEELRTGEGTLVVRGMIAHGMMDENLQPRGLSQAEMGVVVMELSKRLGISQQWKVFGELWNMKPDTLRRSFYKAQEQKKTLGFYDKLKEAMAS